MGAFDYSSGADNRRQGPKPESTVCDRASAKFQNKKTMKSQGNNAIPSSSVLTHQPPRALKTK